MPYVPPWLDVSPNTFLQASEAGAAAGARSRGLDLEQAGQAQALQESAADRALRQSLSQRAQDLAQNKQAQIQDYRERELGLRAQGLDVASERLQKSWEAHQTKAQQMADSAQLFADTVPNLPEDQPWMPIIAANPKLSTNPGAVAQAKFHDQQLSGWKKVSAASDTANAKEQITIKLRQAKDAEAIGDLTTANQLYRDAMDISGGGTPSSQDNSPPDYIFNPDTGKVEKAPSQ